MRGRQLTVYSCYMWKVCEKPLPFSQNDEYFICPIHIKQSPFYEIQTDTMKKIE